MVTLRCSCVPVAGKKAAKKKTAKKPKHAAKRTGKKAGKRKGKTCYQKCMSDALTGMRGTPGAKETAFKNAAHHCSRDCRKK